MNNYEILGIDKNADRKSIQKAYKKALKKSQKSAHAGNAAAKKKIKKLKTAYTTLNDVNKRKLYDAELNSSNTTSDKNLSKKAVSQKKEKSNETKKVKNKVAASNEKSNGPFFDKRLDIESIITICILIGFFTYFLINGR